MTTIATILPQARTVFLDENNVPLSGGSVYMYIPNTTDPKTTWQDAAGATSNANPIVLDGQGSCLLYGSGQYLQEVYDALGNLIWNGLTQDVYGFVVGENNVWTGTNEFTGAASFISTVSLGSQATATTQALNDDTTAVATDQFVQNAINNISAIILQKFISGCLLTSITGNNTTAAITVTAGQAAAQTYATGVWSTYLTSAGYSWSAANGNVINGTDAASSTLADSTTYHMYLISGASGTGVFASATFPGSGVTFPTGYAAYYRRIGSFVTNSSGAPLPYVSIETEGGAILNWLATQILDITVSNLGSSARSLYTLSVPTGIKVGVAYRTNASTTGQSTIITSGDETDVAPTNSGSGTYFSTVPGYDSNFNTIAYSSIRDGLITTNTSGQIGARSTTTSVNFYWVTRGWKDWRRS